MLTPKQQANLRVGEYLKFKDQIIMVDHIGVGFDEIPYVEFYVDDGPRREDTNCDEFSKLSQEENLAHRQRLLDQH
jgi:hypothetical protein